MTEVLAESQTEIKERWMRQGNIEIKLNVASGRKLPYTLKQEIKVLILTDVKKKYAPEQGGWGKGIQVTCRESIHGAPRTELKLEIIGAPQRDLRAQWNGSYSKEHNRKKKAKNVTCLQMERFNRVSRED